MGYCVQEWAHTATASSALWRVEMALARVLVPLVGLCHCCCCYLDRCLADYQLQAAKVVVLHPPDEAHLAARQPLVEGDQRGAGLLQGQTACWLMSTPLSARTIITRLVPLNWDPARNFTIWSGRNAHVRKFCLIKGDICGDDRAFSDGVITLPCFVCRSKAKVDTLDDFGLEFPALVLLEINVRAAAKGANAANVGTLAIESLVGVVGSSIAVVGRQLCT